MAIIIAKELTKGERANLDLNVFHVGLGWDVNDGASPYPFDLDVEAFMLASNKKLLNDDYLVYYNSGVDYDSGHPDAAKAPYRLDPADLEHLQPFDSDKYHAYLDDDNVQHSARDAWREQTRPVSPDWSVIGSIDDTDGETSADGDDETLDINLEKVDPAIQEIVICLWTGGTGICQNIQAWTKGRRR